MALNSLLGDQTRFSFSPNERVGLSIDSLIYSGSDDVQTKRIVDLDEPIYRIFSLWYLEESIRTRSIALLSPRSWEDAYEDIFCNIFMNDTRVTPWKQKSLEDYLSPVFAQCWSRENNSDTLLRAYSRVSRHAILSRNTEPNNEGVIVKTTPRKLINAVKINNMQPTGMNFYIDSVVYDSEDKIIEFVQFLISEVGISGVQTQNIRAASLFLKRKYFRHEAEIRFVAVSRDKNVPYNPYRLQIDPNALFDSVSFDPRLVTFERKERQEYFKSLGYTGQFLEVEHPRRILFSMQFPQGWGDDDNSLQT